jgi:thiol-disulfide isomerase/thioredoxin
VKGYLAKLPNLFLVVLTCFIASLISTNVSKGTSIWGLGAVIGFVLFFLLSNQHINRYRDQLSVPLVIATSVIAIMVAAVLLTPSLRFSYKMLPSTFSYILGVYSALLYNHFSDIRRLVYPGILLLVPLVFNFNFYDLWVHKVEYGSYSGIAPGNKMVRFTLTTEDGTIVNNQSIKGKIILLDFWFIGCRPCYVKFPQVQHLHDKFAINDLVEIYAVNRPMPRDNQGEAFENLTQKDYSFPVLMGNQEILEALDVYVYPTVILLDQNGMIVFKGEIEEAELLIESLIGDS